MHVRLLSMAVSIAVCFAVLGGVAAVSAAQPVTASFIINDVNVPVTNCGSFTILGSYQGTITQTVFFDKDGVPVRLQFHGLARGSLVNSVTGYSVKDAPSVRNGFIDLTTGTEAYVGVDFHITVPGSGVVVLQVGRIVFSAGGPPPVFVAGPHLGPPSAADAVLCAALNH